MSHGFDEAWATERARKASQTAKTGSGATIATPAAKRAKYRNKPVLVDLGPSGETVNGHLRLVHTFQSQREADYFAELKLRRMGGEILGLRLQEPFALKVMSLDGLPVIVGEYLADYMFYTVPDGVRHVVDAKGKKTDMYILKKKIVEACHAIRIEEV